MFKRILSSLLFASIAATAQATFVLRDLTGDNVADAVYDTVGDITYSRQVLAHSNWTSAMAWAEGLVLGGISEWRLPNVPEGLGIFQNGPVIIQPFGGVDHFGAISQFFDAGLFNVVWTSQEIPGLAGSAMIVSLGTGHAFISFKEPLSRTGALAVHAGSLGVDLNAVNAVPAPGTLALVGLGMLALAFRKVSR